MSRYKYARWVDTHLDVTQRSGEEWVAHCIYPEKHKHGDRTPSFSINVRTGAWICWSCNSRGGIRHLEKHFHSQAISGVNEDLLLGLREEMSAAMDRQKADVEHINIYPESWLNQFDNPTHYWHKRGFSQEFVEEWRLGYDIERNAATIPLRTLDGRVIGVIRRQLRKGAKPKYLYPKNFHRVRYLWGAHAFEGSDMVAVGEGSVDALAMLQAKIPAVAILGSMASENQGRILRGLGARTVVTALDPDKAGQLGTHDLHAKLAGMRHLVVADFGDKKDIAELSVPARRAAVRSAIPFHEWRQLPGIATPEPTRYRSVAGR